VPNKPKYIVGLGELLFDIIDNTTILGGAPVNFAIQSHQILRAHGYRGAAAVRVGNDELATRAINELQGLGLATEFIQHDRQRPTGTAIVHREGNDHRFEIVEQVCWDHFHWDQQLEQLCNNTAVICFGTLGQRSPASRETVRRFVENAKQALRVFDVNIRQHYYDDDSIRHGCQNADILKLNNEEVSLVASALGVPAQHNNLQTCQLIQTRTNLQYVVYTQGALGTAMISANEITTGSPVTFPAVENADAVGAGDACTAGIIAGILLKLTPQKTVALANTLGAFVASQAGATPALPTQILP